MSKKSEQDGTMGSMVSCSSIYSHIQTAAHVAEISTCESDLLLESGTMRAQTKGSTEDSSNRVKMEEQKN